METLSACLLSLGILCSSGTAAAAQPSESAAVPASAPASVSAPEAEKTAAPAKRSASAVLASVQAFYDGTKDFQANFKQTYVHPVYATRTVTRGTMILKKPGMMVWDYEGAGDPDFYVDGDSMWVVEHDTRQVVSQKVDKNANLAGAMKFLFGGQKLIKEFKVRLASDALIKRYGIPGHTVIELKPKVKDPHYKTLLLVVDDATGRVNAFIVRNRDNSINHFELSKTKLNLGLKKAAFRYKVPAGYVETKE
ncbi:MAG: outer membrane lipoprotein carrier protein LolA [Nannocystaceae bacterium]